MAPPSHNLVQRIAVAVVAIPVVVGIIWLGGWALAATLAVLGVLGAREIYDFGRRQGIEPLERTGWLAAAGIPLLAYWAKAPAFLLGVTEIRWSQRSASIFLALDHSTTDGLPSPA